MLQNNTQLFWRYKLNVMPCLRGVRYQFGLDPMHRAPLESHVPANILLRSIQYLACYDDVVVVPGEF